MAGGAAMTMQCLQLLALLVAASGEGRSVRQTRGRVYKEQLLLQSTLNREAAAVRQEDDATATRAGSDTVPDFCAAETTIAAKGAASHEEADGENQRNMAAHDLAAKFDPLTLIGSTGTTRLQQDTCVEKAIIAEEEEEEVETAKEAVKLPSPVAEPTSGTTRLQKASSVRRAVLLEEDEDDDENVPGAAPEKGSSSVSTETKGTSRLQRVAPSMSKVVLIEEDYDDSDTASQPQPTAASPNKTLETKGNSRLQQATALKKAVLVEEDDE